VRLQTLVTHLEAHWQRPAAVENIGLGGARLAVGEAIAVRDRVTASFAAPNLGAPLVLRARVAWVAPGEAPRSVGVAFDYDSADAAFALYELIATFGYD
jgi:hypothetical protein